MDAGNDNNSDEDYEDEELLVYLDFQSKIKSESLEEPNIKIKMIGFETDEPVIQINNKMFRGTFEHAMGTNVFFTEDANPPSMDPNFESIPSTMYKYFTQTEKVLKMERLFITPNQDNDELNETQSDEDVVPNESYLEALNEFLAPGQLPPRTLSGSDILKPAEFQSFFRPQINQSADDEQSERTVEQMETEIIDNSERTETAAAAVGSDSAELNIHPIKVETIKQEQQ